MEKQFWTWVLQLATTLWFAASLCNAQLVFRFYDGYGGGCLLVENKISDVVDSFVDSDPTVAAGLLRMNFHDCFVEGCDASVLILSNTTNTAERDALPNINSLRGFEVIEAAKAAADSTCPEKVSCADIIALAARDAIQRISGLFWEVDTGRRDGFVSLASQANTNIPTPTSSYNQLLQFFANKNLTEHDMVILSGSHKIGFSHCNVIEPRLYNFTGNGAINGTDPSLDSAYANQLKELCPFGTLNKRVPLDPNNGTSNFNSGYFRNVLAKKVLFESDAALVTTPSGTSIVNQEAQFTFKPFYTDFANAMVKLSTISVLTGSEGEIRKNCSFINS